MRQRRALWDAFTIPTLAENVQAEERIRIYTCLYSRMYISDVALLL